MHDCPCAWRANPYFVHGHFLEAVTVRQVQVIQARLPSASAILLNRCKHAPHRDQREATLAIRQFLRTIPNRPTGQHIGVLACPSLALKLVLTFARLSGQPCLHVNDMFEHGVKGRVRVAFGDGLKNLAMAHKNVTQSVPGRT